MATKKRHPIQEESQAQKEESGQGVKERTRELEESRKALMNILEDVEASKREAEKERDKTRAIITNFADGLLVLDKEERITLINPAGERLLDVKAEEVEGRVLKTFTGQTALKKLSELIGSEKTKEGVFRRELILEKPKERILGVTVVALTSREENVVILHDISREKLIEAMKTEFVSLAAHQLRTPLSAIKWTMRMLLDGDLGKITKEQRAFIEKTYKSNERMIALINDLLNITRIEEGRYLFKPVLTDIALVSQFAINSFKEEIQKRRLEFEFKKPEEKLPQVRIDVEKMRLAIQNLIDNAVRYTSAGGKVTISLKYDKNKREIEFSIKDTGVGIPKAQQGRIFTKFFRAVNVIRMETEGTGLGLFITKNIIEAHGGRIWYESEEGKGTTFYFTLPAREEFEEFLKKF